MLPEEGSPLCLTSAALATSNGGTVGRGRLGAVNEEAPETGELGASPVPYGGTVMGREYPSHAIDSKKMR